MRLAPGQPAVRVKLQTVTTIQQAITAMQALKEKRSDFARWSGFLVRAGGLFFGRAAFLRLAARFLGI
jgi:hypothetical protein